jgi:hypothetical protein
MPVSIGTAANYHNRESFSIWDPTTNTFGSPVLGRTKRMDPFVSLWHRSSRRGNIFLVPGQAVSTALVLRHDLTGVAMLLSKTTEHDSWLNGSEYSAMYRIQKASAPSGGVATFYSPTVSGTGDNLGEVSLVATTVYVDVEFRSSSEPNDTINAALGDYLVFCSGNVAPKKGDYVLFGGKYYRGEEWFYDAGFICCRAVQESPRFTLATFYLRGATAPVFDPVTGAMGTGSLTERKVSVTLDRLLEDGRPTEKVEESFDMFIDVRHIGFTPTIGTSVLVSSRTYRVVSVGKSEDGFQWHLKVAP